jgi:dynamin-binding protein
MQKPTAALTVYLNQTRDLAASLSHAWDLPSLLIKPVQRLLKYPLLLAAIISETSDDHPDKDLLIRAKDRIEQVAREVNEGRRRREVVRDVLLHREGGSNSGSSGSGGGGGGRNPKPSAAVLAANLARVKSIRAAGIKGEKGPGDAGEDGNNKHEEAMAVAQMEVDVRRASVFMHDLAKHTMEWARTVLRLTESLRVWAISFARVIGLSIMGPNAPTGTSGLGGGGGETGSRIDGSVSSSDGVKSDAFDAFMLVIDEELLPLGRELQKALKERWLISLARLVNSTRAPLQLIDAMNALEPLHHALLNTTSFSVKQRPSPALLEASQSYVALRGQLAVELPMYLELLDRGITGSVLALADIQARWWNSVREKWFILWEALKVDGEANAGADETLRYVLVCGHGCISFISLSYR